MVAKSTFYGVVAALTAVILVVSSVAALYYYRYEDQASASKEYASELRTALAKYNSLAVSYNASLQDYRTTLLLLASAVAGLDTSSPAYKNASADLVALWNSYRNLAGMGGTKPATYVVDMKVEPGGGQVRWYNDSAVEPGWNGYVVSLVLLSGRVQAVWYPQYEAHFVTGIDGVNGTSTTSWFVWVYGAGGWQLAQTGIDGVRVHNGTVIAWTLCAYDLAFNPACKP